MDNLLMHSIGKIELKFTHSLPELEQKQIQKSGIFFLKESKNLKLGYIKLQFLTQLMSMPDL